jgi:hypothetical protein
MKNPKKDNPYKDFAKIIENLQVYNPEHTAYYDYLFDLLILGKNIQRPMTKPNNDNGNNLCTDV